MNVWKTCKWCRGQFDHCRHCQNGQCLPTCANCDEHVVDGDDVDADQLEQIAANLEKRGGLCEPCAADAAKDAALNGGSLLPFGSNLSEVEDPFASAFAAAREVQS